MVFLNENKPASSPVEGFCVKESIDDSQADVLSEESWQDQVPSPGREPHDEAGEEVEARVSAVLPAADTPEYIGLPDTGEAIAAKVPEVYF